MARAVARRRCWPMSFATGCGGRSSPAAIARIEAAQRGRPGRSIRVSRATIREAVRGLVEEGYLIRRHGSGRSSRHGRCCATRSTRTSRTRPTWRSTGVRAGRRILGIRTVPADEDVAEHLLVDAGSRGRRADAGPNGRSTGRRSIRWIACRPTWSMASAIARPWAARCMRCWRRAATRPSWRGGREAGGRGPGSRGRAGRTGQGRCCSTSSRSTSTAPGRRVLLLARVACPERHRAAGLSAWSGRDGWRGALLA